MPYNNENKISTHLYIYGNFVIDLLKIDHCKNIKMYKAMFHNYSTLHTITTSAHTIPFTVFDIFFNNLLLVQKKSTISCDDISAHLQVNFVIDDALKVNNDDI